MFSLDHLYCARWLTVFIKDLGQLDPNVLSAFHKGYFTVKPTRRIFSNIGTEFGVRQNRKYLPKHKIAYSLGEETCRALPMSFTLTGCDTVSIFSGHGKKTVWKVWKVFPEVTETFARYLFSCQYNTLQMTLFSLSIFLFQF